MAADPAAAPSAETSAHDGAYLCGDAAPSHVKAGWWVEALAYVARGGADGTTSLLLGSDREGRRSMHTPTTALSAAEEGAAEAPSAAYLCLLR